MFVEAFVSKHLKDIQCAARATDCFPTEFFLVIFIDAHSFLCYIFAVKVQDSMRVRIFSSYRPRSMCFVPTDAFNFGLLLALINFPQKQ